MTSSWRPLTRANGVQATLPRSGARVIVGSDGLWDAVKPRDACHLVRRMPARAAATQLTKLAVQRRGALDDVTVLVLDLLPHPSEKLPPLLASKKVIKLVGFNADPMA